MGNLNSLATALEHILERYPGFTAEIVGLSFCGAYDVVVKSSSPAVVSSGALTQPDRTFEEALMAVRHELATRGYSVGAVKEHPGGAAAMRIEPSTEF